MSVGAPVDDLIQSTREVFETMLGCVLQSGTPIEGDALRPKSNVVGTVSFAGECSGVVAFYATTGAARDIAGTLLGIPPSAVNGEVADAIGELTNMIAGSFRSKLASRGGQWVISIPTVTAQWHAAVGAHALRAWELPGGLEEPVLHHHDPWRAPDHVRAAVAYAADRLSHRYGFGCEAEPMDLFEDPWIEAVGITPDWLAAIDTRAPGLFAVAKEALR